MKGMPACIKRLVVFFNILFLFSGLAIVGLAVWSLVSPALMASVVSRDLVELSAFTMLALGAVIILLSFCGCAGAALENRCLLIMFFTIMCGIFFSLVVFGVLAGVFWQDLTKFAEERLHFSIREEYGTHLQWTAFIDRVQSQMNCCAVMPDKANIYQNSRWYSSKSVSSQQLFLPPSCCRLRADGSFEDLDKCMGNRPLPNVNKFMHPKACFTAISEMAIKYQYCLIGTVAGIALLLILGMAFTLALLKGIVHYQPVHHMEHGY